MSYYSGGIGLACMIFRRFRRRGLCLSVEYKSSLGGVRSAVSTGMGWRRLTCIAFYFIINAVAIDRASIT